MDYRKLDGPDLLHEMGQDASKWAAAFCQIHPARCPDGRTIDEGLMIAWFANAIMHALDCERGTIINGEHAQYLADRMTTTHPVNEDGLVQVQVQ